MGAHNILNIIVTLLTNNPFSRNVMVPLGQVYEPKSKGRSGVNSS